MQSTIFRSTHCVRDIATSDLPRDRLLSRGASALSNTELLAVLFGCDPERIRADVCAAGGLAGYMIRHDGALTLGRQARVRAALELARRVMGEELAGREALTSPRDSAAYLKARLAHLPYEVFACLFLDNRHRVLAFEEMFRGTLDGASVHPREVVRAALEHNAAAVILAHNHPSGVAEPSAADRNITHQLRDALQLVGVRVLDHLVVGVGEPTSMAARGLIQPAPTGAPIVRRPTIALPRLRRKAIGPEDSTLDKLDELVGELTRRANAALDHVLAAMKRPSPKWPTSTL